MSMDYTTQVSDALHAVQLAELVNVFDHIEAKVGVRTVIYRSVDGSLVSVTVPINSRIRAFALFKGENGTYYMVTQAALRQLVDLLFDSKAYGNEPWVEVRSNYNQDVRRVWLPVSVESDTAEAGIVLTQTINWYREVVGSVDIPCFKCQACSPLIDEVSKSNSGAEALLMITSEQSVPAGA